MSQSRKPALQSWSVHTKWGAGGGMVSGWHCEVAFARSQVSPQKLQFLLVPSIVAHTFGGSPGQFVTPTSTPTPQMPMTHGCVAEQPMPQAPQFIGSLWRLASQPSVGSLLQSVQPESQVAMAHTPISHAGVACGTTQDAPQAPQLAGSPWRLVSQPFAGSPSQFSKPVSHAPSTHAPAMHACDAFGDCAAHGAQPVGAQPYAGSSTATHLPSHTFSAALHVTPPPAPPPPRPPPAPPDEALTAGPEEADAGPVPAPEPPTPPPPAAELPVACRTVEPQPGEPAIIPARARRSRSKAGVVGAELRKATSSRGAAAWRPRRVTPWSHRFLGDDRCSGGLP